MPKSIDPFEDSFLQDIPVEEKPFPNEHACRLKSPDQFVRFRRKNCAAKHNGKCIDFIFGKKSGGKTELQTMRYPKGKWKASDAAAHCKDHGGKFEAAGR
jgi:hypothetical protein